MASLERKALDAILRRIRERRKRSAGGQSPVRSPRATTPATLREAAFSDFEAITALKRRGGIVIDPHENWKRLWVRNPALDRMKGLAIGWVLEAQGKIVGYLGNVALLYRYTERTLTAVSGTGFVVDPEYRAMSLSLDSAFYRQKEIDLRLATTAIESVAKLAVAFGSTQLPQPDFDVVLFWVLQPYPFAQAVAKKLELAPSLSAVGTVLASIVVQSDKVLRRRWPSQCNNGLEIEEISVSDIGEEFQEFWEGKVRERPRLLADRSAATLRWHFDVPGYRGTVQVLCCRRNRKLVGYVVIRNDVDRPDALRASTIGDLLAKDDDEEIVRALFLASFEIARRAKSHILEVMGFPGDIRRVLSGSRPYMRRLPAYPFYYRTSDPALQQALSEPAAWYACAYDGDRTLMP